MNVYYIKCSKFTNDNTIKVKDETDGETNLYSFCVDCVIL